MPSDTPFFRIRWTLRATRPATLHTHQNAILYALLCDAARGDAAEGPMHMPEGLLLDAPEVGRDHLNTGEEFAFGATLIEADEAQAAKRLHKLSAGLSRLGKVAPKKAVALGGNFDLIDVRDLVAGCAVSPGGKFAALPRQVLSDELEAVLPLLNQPITLRFLSPLRLELPGDVAAEGHRYADGSAVIVGQLLRAVQKRLSALGIQRAPNEPETPFSDDEIELVENRLVWLDLEYGRTKARKSLGGSLGRLRIVVKNPIALAALVWAQHARLGKNLHFGFGRYRIEELGPDRTECPRAAGLLEIALGHVRAIAMAQDQELETIRFCLAAEGVRSGTYQPSPPQRVVLRTPGGGERELQIPPRQDRALQRLLLARLGPAFDKLFETSSYAWRRGLNREAAARRIERLVNDGWVFAVRADFDQFFDSIPHAKLGDRLEAWVGDDRAIAAIMAFVRTGRPEGVGIPTGAPLSPLLGNMFLDDFDERIELSGGRLVRYADDFLILCKSREAAERLFEFSKHLAAGLLLKLNDDSAVLDLREAFDFLGFQFRFVESWKYGGPAGPQRVRELGWKDADRTPSPLSVPLPGETADGAFSGVVVAGPGVERIDVVADRLQIIPADATAEQQFPLESLDRLILIGAAAFAPDAPGKLLRSGVPVQFVSEFGWPLGELSADLPDDPAAITAQCRAAADPLLALQIAIPLVRVKLLNFRALLAAFSPNDSANLSRMAEMADGTKTAPSLESLRGIEGAGAALWYRCLPKFLGPGFRFPGRVSPDANDPVNVLLNIGYTILYRHLIAACRSAGLSPSVGFLHASTSRYAALAADLQEPFRHVVERAVILATRRLKPTQFLPKEDGPHALVLEHHASKMFHAILQRSLRTSVVARGQTDSRAWLGQFLNTARALRRRLTDPDATTWEPFEHP